MKMKIRNTCSKTYILNVFIHHIKYLYYMHTRTSTTQKAKSSHLFLESFNVCYKIFLDFIYILYLSLFVLCFVFSITWLFSVFDNDLELVRTLQLMDLYLLRLLIQWFKIPVVPLQIFFEWDVSTTGRYCSRIHKNVRRDDSIEKNNNNL